MARHSALTRMQHNSIFTYVFHGWQLLLVDVLTRSLWDSTLGAPKLARTALSLGLVLAVDVLGLAGWGMLQDVRGYAVFKAAQQMSSIQLVSLDDASSCAVAVVLCVLVALLRRYTVILLRQSLMRGICMAV